MRYTVESVVLVVVISVFTVIPVLSQTRPGQKPTFEVVSVKPSPPRAGNFRFAAAGGRFSAAPITLRRLLQIAYQPRDGAAFLKNRIIGAPGCIDTDTPFEQRRGIIRRTDDGWVANAVRVDILISVLSQPLERPVLDKTGPEGMFDFKLHWIPPRAATPAGTDTPTASDPADSSIFTAVEELGLNLEAAKVPLDVIVIDSVQKPSEN